MKVSQFKINGRPIANQFVITDGEKVVFQSYASRVCEKVGDDVTLDVNALNYSVTTSKYLYAFLGMKRKEIERLISGGVIAVKDLNAE